MICFVKYWLFKFPSFLDKNIVTFSKISGGRRRVLGGRRQAGEQKIAEKGLGENLEKKIENSARQQFTYRFSSIISIFRP